MKRTSVLTALAGAVAATGLALIPAAPAAASFDALVTGRASVLPGAVEPTHTGDSEDTAISGNGRYLVFGSDAALVAGDVDTVQDVYLKDRLTDQVERINVTVDGSAASGDSFSGAISHDGRYVAFWSWASDLVPGDTNNKADVFVRDRKAGTTERVSVNSQEVQGNGASPSIINGDALAISDDGRYVAFTSSSTNLGFDANTLSDVFVRDRQAGTTTLASVSTGGSAGNSNSYFPSMSANGRYVAFETDASSLVTPDSSGRDIVVRDLVGSKTTRVSLHDNDSQPVGEASHPSISADGTKVAFATTAKLTATDTNGLSDVYVRNLTAASTTLVSAHPTTGAAAGGDQPSVDDSASVVAFASSTNLGFPTNGWAQIYVKRYATLLRASVSSAGVVGANTSSNPMVDGGGNTVSFDSKAPNLVVGDSGYRDAFFRVLAGSGYSYGTSIDDLAAKVSAGFGYRTPASIAASIRAGASIEHLILDAANSPSFAGKRPALIRLYFAYFNRLPDRSGLDYWTSKLDKGTPLDKVSASFAGSSEFTAKYGSKTNSQFVTLIYQNIFSRNPDPSGLAYWTKKLDQGTSRGTVMTNFSESSEGRRKLQPAVDLTLFPLGLTGTIPKGDDLTAMFAAADAANATEGAVRQLIGK